MKDLPLLPARRPGDRALRAARWRTEVYATWVARLAEWFPGGDPLQAYCDLLTHRYYLSVSAGNDVGTDVAFDDLAARRRE